MNIYKWPSHEQIGAVDGNSIKKWPSYEQIGTVDGNSIKRWPSHEQIGTVDGNSIKEWPSHEQIGTIDGNSIKEWPSHAQIGTVDDGTSVQKGAAAFVLLGMLTSNSGSGSSTVSTGSSGEPEGFSWLIAMLLKFFFFLFRTWGGRIGIIAGVVIGIIYGIFKGWSAVGTIFIIIPFVFLFGIIGRILDTKGGRIGGIVSGAFALFFLILSLVAGSNPESGVGFRTWTSLIPFWIILTIVCGLIGKGIGAFVGKRREK